MQHRYVIATGFHIASLVVGIPSAVAFAFLAFATVQMHLADVPSGQTGATGNQMIDLFVSGVRTFGKLFEFFGGAVKWVASVLTVVSLVALLLAVGFFFTSRGLHAGRTWARVLAIALALLPLFISALAMLSTRRPFPFVAATMVAAMCAYVVWALGWRYA